MSVRATPSTLVARAAELAALRAAVERASSGDAATVIVSGDAGVGKSRLVAELLRTARDDGALVLLGRCVDVGDGELAYAPIAGALRSLATQVDALQPPDAAAAWGLLGAPTPSATPGSATARRRRYDSGDERRR
jgi:predicted ATPase